MPQTGRERRVFPRRRVSASADILVNNMKQHCVVIDRSAGGVGLLLRDGEQVPDQFTLVTATGEHLPLQVVWRHYPKCGAIFREAKLSAS
ncbi:MAG: PilZ domain-containing protein [Caulobacteraceae bacterium]